jgi:hypothetical protein
MKHIYFLFGVLIMCTYLFSRTPSFDPREKNKETQEKAVMIQNSKTRILNLLKEAQSSLNTTIKSYNTGALAESLQTIESNLLQLQEAQKLIKEIQ